MTINYFQSAGEKQTRSVKFIKAAAAAVTASPATQVSFKSCAGFTRCITKINGTIIDDAEDLDLVMPMCNNADFANDNKPFKFKAKLVGNTTADGVNGILKNKIIAVPLKYLSNFWRLLEMQLINCKVQLKL